MSQHNTVSRSQTPSTLHPQETLEKEIFSGLMKDQKEIHPKFLYDLRGSELFEQICELKEYYPTRTEVSILKNNATNIAQSIGKNCFFIEFGSGASIKIRILLDALENVAGYVPIDISKDFLFECARKLRNEYPKIPITPIAGDYTTPLAIPHPLGAQIGKKVAFFPGSTFGNFKPDEATSFLKNTARLLGTGGLFLIGIDLIKNLDKLNSAYNDSQGVTAAFNMNILARMNREFNANFDMNFFRHRAFFNTAQSRIEMHLVSLKDQLVTVADQTFRLSEGETIHTENSYKFMPKNFEKLVETIGYSKLKLWTDPEEMFAVYLLEVKAREF